ncbi:MAG: hypothetical protein HOU01_12760, partial [Streptomycetaceae bacterium]|nr:hypothetical protein [Streptomycetaceae bacterium]
QKETRYYAVDIPAGATAYFSGPVSFPRRAGVGVGADLNTLTLRVMDANGADCNVFEHEMATRSSDGEALTVAKMWEGATKEKSGSGSSANCKGGGRYVFSVQWDHVSAGAPARLPIELLVGIEPGVSDPGPKAVLPNMAFADPSGPQTPVTGGGSFNVAAPLPGAGSYTDTLQYGEFVFYKVRLDWGQGLAYRVTYEANGGRGVESITNWETSYFTPFRQRIDFDTGAYTGLQQVSPGKYKELATVPIRYANRQSDTVALRRQSVAGWYYIAVKVGKPSAKGSPAPVRIRLDVTVDGHDSAGPTYTGSADVFGDNSPPKRPAAATGDIDSQSKAASPEKDSHTGLIIGIAAAVAVIAAATGGFLVTRLRSRR